MKTKQLKSLLEELPAKAVVEAYCEETQEWFDIQKVDMLKFTDPEGTVHVAAVMIRKRKQW